MKKLLLSISVLLCSLSMNAQTTEPVTISSGFNKDVICEDNSNISGTITTTTDTKAQGLCENSFVFVSTDVDADGGVCGSDGVVEGSSGVNFKFNVSSSGVVNNALVMKGTYADGEAMDGTLVFETPTKAKTLYVAGMAADAAGSVDITVNYNDGTSSDATTWSVPDWGAGGGTVVKSGLKRMCSVDLSWGSEKAGDFQGGAAFYIYQTEITTDSSKEIKSVYIKRADTGGHPSIFGLAIEPAESTGVNNIENDANKTVQAVYGADGQQLNDAQHGVNIIKYSDGTTRKVVRK